MPSSRATRRASSTASLPQHEPNRRVGSSDSSHGHTRMVTPTTSTPRSTRSAAATDESTPPDIPTTTREDMTATGSIIDSPRTAGPQPRDVLRLGSSPSARLQPRGPPPPAVSRSFYRRPPRQSARRPGVAGFGLADFVAPRPPPPRVAAGGHDAPLVR